MGSGNTLNVSFLHSHEPKAGESPQVARILYIKFREYLEKWDVIENIFSQKAINQGSFDHANL